jgi:hypothetical protein
MKNSANMRTVFRVGAVLFMAVLLLQVSCQFCNAYTAGNAQTVLGDGPVDVFGEAGSDATFSIIWITDTQYLSESHPTYFDALCRWIVNNAETCDVKMVVHTGDLVEDEWNTTHWENANNSMSILLNNGIPYCWDAGNHDYTETCWIGDQFVAFNPAVLAEKLYWVGDKFAGQNTAVHFSVSNQDFLIVNLAYLANDSVLEWANSVLDAYPESHAIVAAHFYLNRTGGYESWAVNLKDTVLDTHPNVFLTLSGHVYPLANSGLRTQVGGRHELVFNRQEKDSYMGAASLRILTFDTVKGTIDVKTFYLYANTFLVDSNNQFTLDTTFYNDSASPIPELPSTMLLLVLVVLSTVVVIFATRKMRGYPLQSARPTA